MRTYLMICYEHAQTKFCLIQFIKVLRSWEKSKISPEECYRILPFSKSDRSPPSFSSRASAPT